jgi:cellobiose-specific phosphotransferase system component IIC
MTVHITIPVKEIDDKITAVMFFVVSFLWDFGFHFGSVFKIINVEKEIFR